MGNIGSDTQGAGIAGMSLTTSKMGITERHLQGLLIRTIKGAFIGQASGINGSF